MQTLQLQNRRGAAHCGAAETHQAGCSLLNAEGEIDLRAGYRCESVRQLLQELISLRRSAAETGWRLDRLGRAIVLGQHRVELTRTQFSIVEVMARANCEFVSVHDLLMGVWGFAQPIGGGELVRTHIRAIRRRLRQCGIADDLINGSRGRGYRINPRFRQPAPVRPLLAAA